MSKAFRSAVLSKPAFRMRKKWDRKHSPIPGHQAPSKHPRQMAELCEAIIENERMRAALSHMRQVAENDGLTEWVSFCDAALMPKQRGNET